MFEFVCRADNITNFNVTPIRAKFKAGNGKHYGGFIHTKNTKR
jgi:hypothetical protein